MYEENRSAVKAFQEHAMAQMGQLAGAQAVRDVSQWEVAAKRHAEVLSKLTEGVKGLANRLHPVLRPSAPTPTAGQTGNKQSEALAPVAAAMHQISDEIEILNYIVGDVLNRLEL